MFDAAVSLAPSQTVTPDARASRVGAPKPDIAESAVDALAALLRGEHVRLDAQGLSSAALYEACVAEELTGLIHDRIGGEPDLCDMSPDVRAALARQALAAAAHAFVRQREVVAALDRLAAEGVHPILFKGTPLAYSVYTVPSSRPRSDTDLFIDRDEVETVRRVMRSLGYTEPPCCDGELLFCQFQVERTDRFNVLHAFDFHWKISTQPVFADLLTLEELRASAEPVPALGLHARAPSRVHALLIACVHPVMHHRNVERLLWIHDVHLLSGQLTDAEFDRFADLAASRAVASAAARGLALARERLGTRVPERVMARLATPHGVEASADYLKPGRQWIDELRSSLRGLPRWRDRLRLLREIAFPTRHYMLTAYGRRAAATPLLPVLYAHRLVRGALNVLTGRK